MEDLPQEVLIKNDVIVEFLENKIREIIAVVYLLSIAEMKNGVQHIGDSVLLIVSNYILRLIWGNYSTINLFDSHSKDENGQLSSSGTAILKFDILHSVENYIRFVYYNSYPLTIY